MAAQLELLQPWDRAEEQEGGGLYCLYKLFYFIISLLGSLLACVTNVVRDFSSPEKKH